ncbi:hypothetical protein BT69DRAFT_36406 [Atractiella rhizophila]|nr:hypothetical protein BT69DRAFT_36406 [Atractiella rhizophila]
MDPALRKSLIMSAVSSFATLGIATYYLTQYAPQLPAPPPLVHVSTTTSTSTTAPSGKKECEHCANANSKKASGSSKAVASGSGSTKDDPKEKEKEKDANRKGPDEGKSYRTCRQYWNEQTSSWQTRTHVPPKKTEEMNEGCLFVANHRTLLPKHQVQAEDYWHIEVLDEQLVKDLRTQLTEVEAIYEVRRYFPFPK